MAKTKISKKSTPKETDGAYLLKLALYLIVGSFWVKVTTGETSQIPIPAGFIVGVLFAMQDRFRIDRKIEYALLLVAMLVGFWLPIGLFVYL